MPARDIARLGGLARIRRLGNPGTVVGRAKGGRQSLSSHSRIGTGFKLLRKIKHPRTSAKLAELIGIYMGDGHLSAYQGSVVTNCLTDSEHAQFIKGLQEELFGIPVSISKKSGSNALIILISSKAVSNFLTSHGMPIGNKLTHSIEIPIWVKDRIQYSRALVRGLIDTDGSVYVDRHKVKGKNYHSTCLAFTSASPELREFVFRFLLKQGYTPTTSGNDVRLRRKQDVVRYMTEVGSNNPKHLRKFKV